jgi:hypothetical protein
VDWTQAQCVYLAWLSHYLAWRSKGESKNVVRHA